MIPEIEGEFLMPLREGILLILGFFCAVAIFLLPLGFGEGSKSILISFGDKVGDLLLSQRGSAPHEALWVPLVTEFFLKEIGEFMVWVRIDSVVLLEISLYPDLPVKLLSDGGFCNFPVKLLSDGGFCNLPVKLLRDGGFSKLPVKLLSDGGFCNFPAISLSDGGFSNLPVISLSDLGFWKSGFL